MLISEKIDSINSKKMILNYAHYYNYNNAKKKM